MLFDLGYRSWIYREGKTRNVFILETSASFLDTEFDPNDLLSDAERIGFVKEYFDAEGGVPRSASARFYVQFVQKNLVELTKVKFILERFDIQCGVLHNPSRRVDPDYWRFFVRTCSHRKFASTIGSFHPRKEKLLQRMMI